jgi:predicted GH43/DUF377 family glycosyl hydrolase
MSIQVKRTDIFIKSDINRVILRPFQPSSEERYRKIIQRIFTLSETKASEQLQKILAEFELRHREIKTFFLHRFDELKTYLPDKSEVTTLHKLLIGAYFTLEYSLEAASLFNPCMIWHPDQSNLGTGERRFIISLRATGEGHVSSIVFRSGTIDNANNIRLNQASRYVTTPQISLEKSGYRADFSPQYSLAERVLFPFAPEECNGMEDARFVEFSDDKGKKTYYATYTAYDGKRIYSMLLHTDDFLGFQIKKIEGAAVQNKGLALFPRKIKGKYVMLSRQDNENNYIMFSDDLMTWPEKQLIMEPRFPWEFFQIGNCGCPIETIDGWLVLAHGVGAMRKYVISAFLLDLDSPSQVISRLPQPLLTANASEREGYVPNVVYTCGGKIHGDVLVFPYAMSDYASSFALVNLNELLNELKFAKL